MVTVTTKSRKKTIETSTLLYGAWFLALASLLGSLYFSQVKHVDPCILCWYQRVLMYPLVFVLAVGIVRKDANVPYYVIPLSTVGALVAFYHSLLQWGVLSEALAPCKIGVSCVTKYSVGLSWITIPFLSFLAFGAITIAMVWVLKQKETAMR
jgi:disulfide bond formation protein DsbB